MLIKNDVCKLINPVTAAASAFVYANGIDDNISNCESYCSNTFFKGCCRYAGKDGGGIPTIKLVNDLSSIQRQ